MSDNAEPLALDVASDLALLERIWLAGVVSGAVSAVQNIAPTAPAGVADAFADDLASAIIGDPLAMAELRNEIQELLAGTDSGPKTWNVPGQVT